eukprot:450953-Heterocapsa_arctica.AAC.1
MGKRRPTGSLAGSGRARNALREAFAPLAGLLSRWRLGKRSVALSMLCLVSLSRPKARAVRR